MNSSKIILFAVGGLLVGYLIYTYLKKAKALPQTKGKENTATPAAPAGPSRKAAEKR